MQFVSTLITMNGHEAMHTGESMGGDIAAASSHLLAADIDALTASPDLKPPPAPMAAESHILAP
eukprot:4916499-Lingulodinium_polyedra.AAC.1